MVPRLSLRSFQRLRITMNQVWNSQGSPGSTHIGETESRVEQLIPAGRILWFFRTPSHFVEVKDPEEVFEDIMVSTTMFSAHLPQNYASLYTS